MFELSNNFADEKSQELLFKEEFWEEIAISLVNAIIECTTSQAKHLTKMTTTFREMKKEILDYIARQVSCSPEERWYGGIYCLYWG